MAINTVQFTLNGQTVNLSYDSASGSYKGTVTAPGTTSWNANDDHKYHGTVKVTDTAGNSVTATVTDFSGLALRVLEKTKPTIGVTYPTAGAYITNSKPTIKWTVADADSGIDASTISIQIDGGAAVTDGITKTAAANGYTCEYTPSSALAEGSHTFTFAVSDNDGNGAAATSVTCTIDTVPPTLNLTSPADGAITNVSSLTVTGTTNDATSSPVTVTVNGTAVTVGSDGGFTTNLTLSEGSNTITVVAKDAAGKTTTVTRTVTLDTGIPTITSVTLTPNPVDAGATYIVTVTVSD
jgi:hypothetical protein